MRKYIRMLDSEGRVSVPREIINANHIDENTLFHVITVPEGILLMPADGSCAVCGGIEDLSEIDGAFFGHEK